MGILSHIPSVVHRWFAFNFVGAMGILVQMGILWGLTSALHLRYLIATALAVEAAVLHNFFWHERWTWADRVARYDTGVFSRLLYFHLSNGALSIAGNLVLMSLLVEKSGLRIMYANALSIAVCSFLNFILGDRLVFRSGVTASQKGDTTMSNETKGVTVFVLFLATSALFLCAARTHAAELQPQTVKAWQSYVEMAEGRIGKELSSQKGFLALDFQSSSESSKERQSALSGKIPIKQMPAGDEENPIIHVPDGMVHHWRGSVFIPGVPLDFVFSRVTNPSKEDTRQEDVLDSRVLESTPGQLKLYLKLQRSKIVTVIYNTEHLVRYQWHGTAQAFSSSTATKISEIERLNGTTEREKPEGQDRGFLWRMNSYWRYQQVPGGVMVECESITLSRSIPSFLEFMVRPIINRVARESMNRTLQSMKARILRSYALRADSSHS